MSVPAVAGIFDGRPVGGMSTRELEDGLVGYAAQITALSARFLELLAEFDERSGWSGEGITSCAHWLSWRVGLAPRTAHDHVRVARALRELPRIAEQFAAGRLSFSKVRALTRVATAEREEELVNVALSSTAKQVEILVGALRRCDREQHEDATGHVDSSGQWCWNSDGTLTVTARLSVLDGARFLAGLVRAEYERTRTDDDADLENPRFEAQQTDSPDGQVPPHRRRDLWRHVPRDIAATLVAMADALHDGIEMPEVAPGAEVVVNTLAARDSEASPEVLIDPHIEGGPVLSDAELAEAECGAARREAVRGNGFVVLKWGRKGRMPTAALIRIISARDNGCTHPGCGRTRHLHIHHVRPWSLGGTTDPDNLILLCSTHHRALHQGVFGIVARGGQRFTFHRPDGSTIPRAPVTSIPSGWLPDPAIDPNAPTPINGGILDLGYTTEVLYAAWAWKAQARQQAEAA